MKITVIGTDLAKNLFQIHGVDERGKTVLKTIIKRDELAAFFVNLPARLIGMEACGGTHHWARKLQSFGNEVKLMAPQFVKPFVRSNKNDAADVETICEVVSQPNMRFVAVKMSGSGNSPLRAKLTHRLARTDRNAATRGGKLEYRASVAQWKSELVARRPNPAKLVVNPCLRQCVQNRQGKIQNTQGRVIAGPQQAQFIGRNKPHRDDRKCVNG